MSCKDGMIPNVSTVMAPVVKPDSSLCKKLEKMLHKVDCVTPVFPPLLSCFIYIQYKAWFCLVKCTRSLEESYILVWGELRRKRFLKWARNQELLLLAV